MFDQDRAPSQKSKICNLTNSTDYYIIVSMNKGRSAKLRQIHEGSMSFEQICRRHGLKITPQRVAIYNELSSSRRHPSAVAIHAQVRRIYPNISLGTVNTTLLTFARIGLVRVVESSGDPKRFDPVLAPHHHFRCLECGKIVDFNDRSYDNIAVPAEIRRKYLVLGTRLHLEGLCDSCKLSSKMKPSINVKRKA